MLANVLDMCQQKVLEKLKLCGDSLIQEIGTEIKIEVAGALWVAGASGIMLIEWLGGFAEAFLLYERVALVFS